MHLGAIYLYKSYGIEKLWIPLDNGRSCIPIISLVIVGAGLLMRVVKAIQVFY